MWFIRQFVCMDNLTPQQTWDYLQQNPQAAFVDVRMEIESLYVGRPPGVVNIPWYEYPELTPNPEAFVAAVRREAPDLNQPVVLICRSGKRTVDAAHALEAAGFTQVVNVLFGFEGDLDDTFHRSTRNGWRHDGLPWEQL